VQKFATLETFQISQLQAVMFGFWAGSIQVRFIGHFIVFSGQLPTFKALFMVVLLHSLPCFGHFARRATRFLFLRAN